MGAGELVFMCCYRYVHYFRLGLMFMFEAEDAIFECLKAFFECLCWKREEKNVSLFFVMGLSSGPCL